jgi:hypothetical protein
VCCRGLRPDPGIGVAIAVDLVDTGVRHIMSKRRHRKVRCPDTLQHGEYRTQDGPMVGVLEPDEIAKMLERCRKLETSSLVVRSQEENPKTNATTGIFETARIKGSIG